MGRNLLCRDEVRRHDSDEYVYRRRSGHREINCSACSDLWIVYLSSVEQEEFPALQRYERDGRCDERTDTQLSDIRADPAVREVEPQATERE